MAKPLTADERFWAVMLKTRGRCWYCGIQIWPAKIAKERGTVDHVVGRTNGGSGNLENLVPACSRCNSSKCAREMDELRHNAALRHFKMPSFSRSQIQWMRDRGADLSSYDGFRFWFETHKTRHISEWTDGEKRREINKLLRWANGL
jgi:hypothetical protein